MKELAAEYVLDFTVFVEWTSVALATNVYE